MERHMIQVCERRKTKNDMLIENIEQYKDMFIRAKRDFNKVMDVRDAFIVEIKVH
jgi:DNA topoisomerase III